MAFSYECIYIPPLLAASKECVGLGINWWDGMFYYCTMNLKGYDKFCGNRLVIIEA